MSRGIRPDRRCHAYAIAPLLAAALTMALLAQGAHAQSLGGDGGGSSGGGGGRKQHHAKTDKDATPKLKADDKAYGAALKSLPNKPYDPWHNAR